MQLLGLLLGVFAIANLALSLISLLTHHWIKFADSGVLQPCLENQTNCTVKVLLAGGAALLGIATACCLLFMCSCAITRTMKAAASSFAIAALCQTIGMAVFTGKTHIYVGKPGYSFIIGWVSMGVTVLLVVAASLVAHRTDKRELSKAQGVDNPNYTYEVKT